MKGVETVTYTNSKGEKVVDKHNAYWEEDYKGKEHKTQPKPYEHPTAEGTFDITRKKDKKTGRYKLRINSDKESGLLIHGYGRSEGCVTTKREILDDLHKRLKEKETLKINISVQDKRNDMAKHLSPLPYK